MSPRQGISQAAPRARLAETARLQIGFKPLYLGGSVLPVSIRLVQAPGSFLGHVYTQLPQRRYVKAASPHCSAVPPWQ